MLEQTNLNASEMMRLYPMLADWKQEGRTIDDVRTKVKSENFQITDEDLEKIYKQTKGIPIIDTPAPPIVRSSIIDALDRDEAGDAELFADIFKDKFLYDHSSRSWYVWRGNYWEQDKLGEVNSGVRNALAAEYLEASAEVLRAGNSDLATKLSDRAKSLWRRSRRDNVLDWAKSDDRLAFLGDDWDSKPMVLGVKNGVIDLTTGEITNGKPSLYMRTHAPVIYEGLDTPAPQWDEFISGLTDGVVLATGVNHQEMVSFWQRLLGYCITTNVGEHILPIMIGKEGRNGKSTLMETIHFILGSNLTYSVQADVLMDFKRDGSVAQPFIHALQGKRLVWANETKEGQKLNTGLVKQLTGGDTITTRTLHEKPITFTPTHKMILSSNFEPHISSDDSAIWERVLLIEFALRYVDNPQKPNERPRVKDLEKKLESEASGILAWLIRGCMMWQKEGLNPPKELLASTLKYRGNEDTLQDFVDECLKKDEDGKIDAKTLYETYVDWTGKRSDAMGKKTFLSKIEKKLGEPHKRNVGKVFEGYSKVTPFNDPF